MTSTGNSVLSEMAVLASEIGGINSTGPESELTLSEANINPIIPAGFNPNTMTVGTYFSLPQWGMFNAGAVSGSFVFGPSFAELNPAGQSATMLHELLHMVFGSHIQIAEKMGIQVPAPFEGFNTPDWFDFAAGGALNKWLRNNCSN
jgi:hypothetical protein